MKIIKLLTLSLFIVLCHACTSTSEQIKYYRLTPDTVVTNSETNKQLTRVVISPVHVAKVLQQDGIVNHLGKNEINIAHFHRWANSLDEAIAMALVKNINSRTHQYYFEKFNAQINQHANYILSLTIEKFDIRDDASVNISGNYLLLDKNKIAIVEQSFDIKQPLIEDGYSHAVEKLKQTLEQLAEKILIATIKADKQHNKM